jgi:hypothetical protein
MVGGSTNNNFTLTTGQDLLPTLPAVQVPSPFPNSGTPPATPPTPTPITVNTVAISRQGVGTITLYGTKAGANDSLSINGKRGNDNFFITGVGIPTTLEGNDPAAASSVSFNTFFFVGWQGLNAAGQLSGINAALNIVGSKGNDTVVVDDSGDSNDATFVLTPTQVITDTVGPNGSINYDSNIDNLVIFGGTGVNNITVKNTGASSQTTIHGGNGDNTFIINGLLAAPLAINGDGSQTGGDSLQVNGTSAAEAFVITATTITGDGARISYLNLQSLLVMGQGGNDTFTLNGDVIATTIEGADGNDTFIVNGLSAPTNILGGPNPATAVANSPDSNQQSTETNKAAASGNDKFIINSTDATQTIFD